MENENLTLESVTFRKNEIVKALREEMEKSRKIVQSMETGFTHPNLTNGEGTFLTNFQLAEMYEKAHNKILSLWKKLDALTLTERHLTLEYLAKGI